ncbi:RNase H domain-containing protein [Trichonephila clavipes]|nr:RNase H domain-containing protein [Trichonephila clavipes]
MDLTKDCKDGSKFDSGNTGCGVVIKNQDAISKIKRRNPNHCSVLRSVLIAINAALEHMISIKGTRDIWIFTDNLYFNDLADELAKKGSNDPIDSIYSELLTYEIYSKVKTNNNRTWKTPPSHDWYQQSGPGAALELKGAPRTDGREENTTPLTNRKPRLKFEGKRGDRPTPTK